MEETEDLNRLIQDLNAGVRREATGETGRLERWLAALAERGGSDLLLVAGAPAAIRVDGRLTPLSEEPLSGEEIEEAVLPALSSRARMSYAQGESADGSLKARGLGRFRINLHRERGRAAATVRALPSEPPRLASLRLPSGVEA